MLSEGWENEDEKEEQEDLKLEVRKLQEKLHSSEMVISLLKEQLTLSSQAGGSIFQQQVAAGVTQESEQLQVASQGSLKGAPHDSAPQQHCPCPQSVDTSLKETQVTLDYLRAGEDLPRLAASAISTQEFFLFNGSLVSCAEQILKGY